MTDVTQATPVPTERPDVRRWCESRFFQVTLAILTTVYLYVGMRLIGPSDLGAIGQVLAWTLVAGGVALVPLAFWARWGERPPSWGPSFRRRHFLLLGLLFIVMSLLLIRDAGLIVASLAGVLPEGLSGRALVQDTNLAVALVVAAAALHGAYLALRTPRVRRVSVAVDGLPQGLGGLRIVQLSDLHVGPTLKRRFVESVVAEVAALDPHLIAITGDLVDGPAAELADDVAPIGGLRAPLGVWFVPGNHDYYSGIEPWIAELERLGLRTLLNAHEVLDWNGERLVVAGVTDPQGARFSEAHAPDPVAALRGAPEDAMRLLLSHQPRLMREAEGLGVDLQLSGHTHGGQMVPWNLLVKLVQPVVAGLHRTKDGWIYVSRGTGFWGPPLRIGVPSEITLLELRPA